MDAPRQKRKHTQSDDNIEVPLSLHANDSALPIDRFMALLEHQASEGSISCCTRVNTEGMVGDAKDVADGIAGHIWEATGYRFTSVFNVKSIDC